MFGQHDNQTDNDQADDSPVVHAVNPDEEQPSGATQQTWQHPGSPLGAAASEPSDDTVSAPPVSDTATADEPPSLSAASTSSTDDLIDIKQQALSKLSPLVGHLDQSPEEKFRTTMMMIQASDDQSQIKTAYEAALAISDEKTRAQALLDIVNEINYFTQHPDPEN
jgi:hypothetical protein